MRTDNRFLVFLLALVCSAYSCADHVDVKKITDESVLSNVENKLADSAKKKNYESLAGEIVNGEKVFYLLTKPELTSNQVCRKQKNILQYLSEDDSYSIKRDSQIYPINIWSAVAEKQLVNAESCSSLDYFSTPVLIEDGTLIKMVGYIKSESGMVSQVASLKEKGYVDKLDAIKLLRIVPGFDGVSRVVYSLTFITNKTKYIAHLATTDEGYELLNFLEFNEDSAS